MGFTNDGGGPKVIGKNWGKGVPVKIKKTKKFTFTKKPTKTEDEATEITRLKNEYETVSALSIKIE